jgi:hypothetical protein
MSREVDRACGRMNRDTSSERIVVRQSQQRLPVFTKTIHGCYEFNGFGRREWLRRLEEGSALEVRTELRRYLLTWVRRWIGREW